MQESPLAEEVPCGLIDAAGVGGLGIAEPIGDGLGRIMVAARHLEVFWEVDGSGENGSVVFDVCGHREFSEFVIKTCIITSFTRPGSAGF